jgi:exonuclease SbcD
MTTKLKVVKDSDSYIRLGDLVALTFQPHTPRVDVDGFGYSPNAVVPPELFNLHTAHGMAIDHEPPFNTFTLLKDIQTTADLVFCGHYHPGWGIFNRADGKTFVNLGSLTRTAASQPEIQRDISVAILEVRSKTDYTITPIKLLCAKPGDQVLDRSRIEAENARAYAMGEFSALIKTQDGEVAQLDVNTIVETIAAQEKLPQEVVTAALDKINECKGAVA